MARGDRQESAALAAFAAGLRYEDIPQAGHRPHGGFLRRLGGLGAVRRAASAPIVALEKFAAAMGPADGRSEILVVAAG